MSIGRFKALDICNIEILIDRDERIVVIKDWDSDSDIEVGFEKAEQLFIDVIKAKGGGQNSQVEGGT